MSDPDRMPPSGDLSPEEFRRRGHEVIDWIADFLAHSRDLPVLSHVAPGDLLERIPAEGPDDPIAWNDLMRDLDATVLPGITHWNHPRFLAYFANTASAPGILGKLLATALNPNGMLWRTSPAATELEQRVTGWVARWVGLPEMFGMINDTASTSSLVAIAAARQAVAGYRRDSGAGSLARPLRLYVSEQAHSSIEKAALVLGLGQRAVVKIPTDSGYSLDADALRVAVAADRDAGNDPFCAVATLGTTSTTSLDPVAEMAALCREEGMWLHVDAAYAGPAAIVPELRPAFSGWEDADSIVMNPHKWLFTPMCSSLFYTRRPETIREAFSLVPEYLRTDVGATPQDSGEAPPDFMNYGIQLGRPFRALPLWFVLSTYGRRGLEARLREHVAMAAELADRIDAHPDFERLAPTPFSVVCFRHRPGAGAGTTDGRELQPVEHDEWASTNEAILAAVNAGDQTFLSHTRLRGRLTLRIAIGNLGTSRDDLEVAWREIERAASEIG
jgi:aromatic-L-amino-acid decarboxylase